jgi:hypothetical protein
LPFDAEDELRPFDAEDELLPFDAEDELRLFARSLQRIQRAFPAVDEEKDYFGQCPDQFNRDRLLNFSRRCMSSKSRMLFDAARKFQGLTVRRWNPNADETTLSIYLGLIGIDEAASKECGAITLLSRDLWHQWGNFDSFRHLGWKLKWPK